MEYDIADVSYNQDGEMEQFLIFWDEGEPDTRRATAENILLFDPEDELPFDGGLHRFLDGDSALHLSDDPRVVVGQTGNEYSYIISVDGDVVETMPSQASSVLEAVRYALVNEDASELIDLHHSVLDGQVRRNIVNVIYKTFVEADRIEIVANGWLIDGFYLVDWDAKMYTANDDREEGDYVRSGGKAVKKDTTFEFVQLEQAVPVDDETHTIVVDGQQRRLTEREMLFLAKVTWLLDREHYHPDESFWSYNRRWEDRPTAEPNLDKFSL